MFNISDWIIGVFTLGVIWTIILLVEASASSSTLPPNVEFVIMFSASFILGSALTIAGMLIIGLMVCRNYNQE